MCFHGQCIMTESEILPTRIYESNWFEKIDARRDGDYGKILYMFMERLKQNGQILIGKLFPLSLNTFKVVCTFFLFDFLNNISTIYLSHYRSCRLHTAYWLFFVRLTAKNLHIKCLFHTIHSLHLAQFTLWVHNSILNNRIPYFFNPIEC